MPSPPALAPPRLFVGYSPPAAPDAATQPGADGLRSAFAAAARLAPDADAPPGSRTAVVSALDAAVRAYVSGGKAAGLPVERVLIHVDAVTRRRVLPFRSAREAAALGQVVFRAFLGAYYGDADVGRTPSRETAPRDPTSSGWPAVTGVSAPDAPPAPHGGATRRPETVAGATHPGGGAPGR